VTAGPTLVPALACLEAPMKLRPAPLIPRSKVSAGPFVMPSGRWCVVERTHIGFQHHHYPNSDQAYAAIEPAPDAA
jgi:hypothetical protein